MERALLYDKIDTIELKPCPFCGHTQKSSQETRPRLWIGGMDTYVQCGACKARGFRVDLPDHIDDLNEHMDLVADVDVFSLPSNPRDFGEGEIYLWMGQLAAKFWNNRKEPRK